MANVGSVIVKVEPELSEVFRIVIAATKLEAAFYHDADAIRALPDGCVEAFAELQAAVRPSRHIEA